MGTKALIRLLIILVVIGAIAAGIHFFGNGGGISKVTATTDKTSVFSDFPINDVAEVLIEQKSGNITLKKGEKNWVVAERDNYPAKEETIISILRGIWDMKIVQIPPIGRSQYGRLQLLAPSEASEEEAAKILQRQRRERTGISLARESLRKIRESP